MPKWHLIPLPLKLHSCNERPNIIQGVHSVSPTKDRLSCCTTWKANPSSLHEESCCKCYAHSIALPSLEAGQRFCEDIDGNIDVILRDGERRDEPDDVAGPSCDHDQPQLPRLPYYRPRRLQVATLSAFYRENRSLQLIGGIARGGPGRVEFRRSGRGRGLP